MLELVPGCLFKFLTRDGNANTNKGACLWGPLIFLSFLSVFFVFEFWAQNNVVFISSKYEL